MYFIFQVIQCLVYDRQIETGSEKEKRENNVNKKHSENADTSMPVTFDVDV